jgi:hypothetical protein
MSVIDSGPGGRRQRVRVPAGLLDFWGRCYDHNFLRFLPIFGKKNWRFSRKTNVMFTIFSKNSSSLSKKRQFFC